MDAVTELLSLPIGTLVSLSAGYLAYRIAYIGHEGPHGTVDVVFLSFAFSSIAAIIIWLLPTWPIPGLVLAVCSTLLCAVLWRVLLSPLLTDTLRRCGVSDHDRGRNVWESMLMRKLKSPTRLIVDLKDGRQIMCGDLRAHYSAPMGPCLLGSDGSVALYVTATRPNTQSDWIEREVFDPANPGWGHEMTFVPASEVARVRMTRPA